MITIFLRRRKKKVLEKVLNGIGRYLLEGVVIDYSLFG
jgi:hypothetical protein